MARCKQFDREEALDKAMRLFWSKGYEASSVSDLLQTMGLNRASLYDTFGDKRSLFLAALDRYVQEVNRANFAILQSDGPAVDALRGYFARLVALSSDEGKLGCMLANTAVELCPHDDEIEEKISAVFDRAEEVFRNLVERGQAQADLDPTLNASDTAAYLMTVVLGIRVRARSACGRASLQSIADTALLPLSVNRAG